MFNSYRIGILHLRGGLGNQLFQLSSLAYYSAKLNFIPLIYDADLYLSDRDNNFPQYRYLKITNWFRNNRTPRALPLKLAPLFRLLLRHISSELVVNESFLNSADKSVDLPRLFFIRDTFEDRRYVDSLPLYSLNVTLSNLANKVNLPLGLAPVAVHIRIAGYPTLSVSQEESLVLTIENLHKNGLAQLDVYSDSIPAITPLLSRLDFIQLNFPERARTLNPIELLFAFCNYKILICNGSSIARWGIYLSSSIQNSSIKMLDDLSF